MFAACLVVVLFNESRLLELSERAQFYQVNCVVFVLKVDKIPKTFR